MVAEVRIIGEQIIQINFGNKLYYKGYTENNNFVIKSIVKKKTSKHIFKGI